ncbi:MAG: cyclomaltodextrinase N-terminal domain-containing protein, partial [Gemmatimonadetes bacterium]|nr:cyclomaltodextrinase N-terminal domain-containing protein [Gemmatimonadota bacterium]
MTRRLAVLVALLVASRAAAAQVPTITRLEPPNWWTGHSLNPVRVLVRGTHLTGATVTCGALTCGTPKVNAAGTAAFVDVMIPRTLAPGAQPIALRTAAGSATATFAVNAPLPRAGRFQGFSGHDAIYLVMVDRFANGEASNDNPALSPGLTGRRSTTT